MKKIYLVGLMLMVGFLFATVTPFTDGFGASDDPGWSAPTFSAGSADSGFTRDFDISTNSAIPALPSGVGDGHVLKVEMNATAGIVQNGYIECGGDDWDNYQVEWWQCMFVNPANTHGTTQFGGVGIRTNGYPTQGYYAYIRTDYSSTYGNYMKFLKNGNEVKRLYFCYADKTKTPDIILGQDDQGNYLPTTNLWIHYKLAANGNVILFYVNDMENPVYTYVDTDSPVASGKVAIFLDDGWDSAAGSDNVLMLIEDMVVSEYTPPTAAGDWNLFR